MFLIVFQIIKEYNHCRNFEIYEMYKEAEVNTHNPTGRFPSRFVSLGLVLFFLIYTYIKYKKFPHGLLQNKSIFPLSFSSFLLPPSFGLILLIVSSMFLIYKQVSLFLDFLFSGIIYRFPTMVLFLGYKRRSFLVTFPFHQYSHTVIWLRPSFVFLVTFSYIHAVTVCNVKNGFSFPHIFCFPRS